MNSFLISIRPKWIAKILNGEKTIEIRRTAPKDWVDYLSGKTKEKPKPMTGYIYCTDPNAKETLSLFTKEAREHHGRVAEFIERKRVDNPDMRWSICNGKVVAKFTLKDVEELYSVGNTRNESLVFITKSDGIVQLYKRSCLDVVTLSDYLKSGKGPAWGYAWHISDLVIFDEPKEITEFFESHECGELPIPITKAPQSWRYVEAKE